MRAKPCDELPPGGSWLLPDSLIKSVGGLSAKHFPSGSHWSLEAVIHFIRANSEALSHTRLFRGVDSFSDCALSRQATVDFPNPLEQKGLIDCIAPAAHTHTHSLPQSVLSLAPCRSILRKYPIAMGAPCPLPRTDITGGPAARPR
jgi:hypothetical protein